MELRQYIRLLRKWLWLIVLGTLLAAGVSYGVSSLLPPVYRASTSLFIQSGGGRDDYGAVIVNQYLATTYSELLLKRPIVMEAGQMLDLGQTTINELMGGAEVWVVPNTSVIRLTIEGHNPRLASEFANAIVSVFMQAQREYSRNILVVEPATVPTAPVAPRQLLNTLLAAIGGCAIATSLALGLEYLNDTLETEEDIRQILSLPTLAAIPALNHRQKRDKNQSKASLPTSLVEAYHTLYAHIQFSNGNSQNSCPPFKTMLITSPLSTKETTDIAINLATVMANIDLTVLLVDANLRQPNLHQIFGLTNETGLTTALTQNRGDPADIKATDIPNLFILPSGPSPLETSPLLNTSRTTQLIELLKSQADIVLFNAPSILEVTEAMVLASQVDGTILAIQSRTTQRDLARQSLERLQNVQANILGVVLDKVRDKRYRLPKSKRRRWIV